MKLIQVINGEITQHSLSKTGTLKNGSTVSGYHLLDEEVLLDEGWLPLEDIKPEYDEETQDLINDGYEILEDKVIKKYSIEDIPEPQLSEVEILNNKIAELENVIDTILGADDIE
ncbi:MAG TPA: hypothetical protein VFC79_09480 [Tissierellaceae bacterium]|nr:hypothetical protein [Tissierellaceae bacterium]